MKNFKFSHCADLGLKSHKYGSINPRTNLNTRFEDIYRTFMFIVNITIKNKCKYIVIAGDINEVRCPNSLLIEKFTKQIKKLLDNNIKVIIIAGNHDIDSSVGTSTSLSYLRVLKLKNLYIADVEEKSFIFQDDDVTFHCIPYMNKHNYNIKENVNMGIIVNEKIRNIKFTTKRNVLVSHYSTEDQFEGLNVDEVTLDLKKLKRFDYVALGHIHRYQMYDKKGINGGYSGSSYQKDFGEIGDKFINLVTFNDKSCSYEKLKLPIRKFVEIEVDASHFEQDELHNYIINKLRGKVKDTIVKIRVRTMKRFNPRLIYSYLKEEGCFYYLPIEWDIMKQNKEKKIKNIYSISNVDIVKEYLKNANDVDKNFKDKVLVFCKGILNGNH